MSRREDKPKFAEHSLVAASSLIINQLRALDGYDGSASFVLAIDPGEFASQRAVGAKKVAALRRLQEQLRAESGADDGRYETLTLKEHPRIAASSLIINQLRALDGYDGSASFVLAIDAGEFACQRAVGTKKVHALLRLQEELRAESDTEAGRHEKLPDVGTRTRLNRALLSKKEVNLLRLLTRQWAWDGGIESLLALEYIPDHTDMLVALRRRIIDELSTSWSDTSQRITESLCVDDRLREIPISVVEEVLLIDIERFVSGLSSRNRGLLRSRWELGQELRTLGDLAETYGATESRMSQLEKQLRKDFKAGQSLSPELLRFNLARQQDRRLASQLPRLRELFVGEESFLRFLECSGDFSKGELLASQSAPSGSAHVALLDHILAYNAPPIPLTQVLEELHTEAGLSPLQTALLFEKHVTNGRIQVTQEGIWPGDVSLNIIVASELMRHPDGLPREDIIETVRARRPDLLQVAQDSDQFRRSPHIYPLGRGFYRHRAFLALDEQDAEVILPALREQLESEPTATARIARLAASIPACKDVPYFDLRCLVSDYAEHYGMYFKGQSRGDSLSLDRDAKGLNAQEAILQILAEADEPLTRFEIQSRLKRGRADIALSTLVQKGQVVHLEYQMYVLRESARRSVDIEEVRCEVIRLVEADQRPLEADVLREQLSPKFGVHHSKYIWAFIASEVGRERGWSVRGTLVRAGPLEHSSLGRLYSATGDLDAPFEDQVRHLESLCRVTESVTNGWFRSWLSAKTRARVATHALEH